MFDSFPRHFAAFHALHRHLAPRHPPYALSSLTTMIPASPSLATEQPANRKTAIHVFSHGHATASAAEWPPISPKFQELKKFSTHACDSRPHPNRMPQTVARQVEYKMPLGSTTKLSKNIFSRESTQPKPPLWAQANADNHLQGLQTTASIRLTKPERVRQVDRQSYRQVARSSSNLVEIFQSFR